MNESEVDAEMKRLREKERVDEKKKRLVKFKEKVDPGLLDKVWKVMKSLGGKL